MGWFRDPRSSGKTWSVSSNTCKAHVSQAPGTADLGLIWCPASCCFLLLLLAALALFYLSADGPALALREVFEAVAEEHDRKSAEEAVDRIDRSSSLLGTPRKSQEDAQGEDFADGVETESGGDSDGGDDDDTGDEERADNAAASGPERKCSPTNTALQGRGGASYQGDRGSVKEAAGESGKDGEGAAAREEAGDSGAFESASPYSRRRLKKKGPSPGAIEVAARLFVGPLLRFLRFRMVGTSLPEERADLFRWYGTVASCCCSS